MVSEGVPRLPWALFTAQRGREAGAHQLQRGLMRTFQTSAWSFSLARADDRLYLTQACSKTMPCMAVVHLLRLHTTGTGDVFRDRFGGESLDRLNACKVVGLSVETLQVHADPSDHEVASSLP